MVKNISSGSGKIRAELWSRFQNTFNLSSYMNLPADRYDDAVVYLQAKQEEYTGGGGNALHQQQGHQGKGCRTGLEGEVMPKPEIVSNNTISLNQGFRMMTLIFGDKADSIQRYSVAVEEEYVSIHQMDNKLMIDVLKDQGYFVFDKTNVSARKMVMDYIPLSIPA